MVSGDVDRRQRQRNADCCVVRRGEHCRRADAAQFRPCRGGHCQFPDPQPKIVCDAAPGHFDAPTGIDRSQARRGEIDVGADDKLGGQGDRPVDREAAAHRQPGPGTVVRRRQPQASEPQLAADAGNRSE